MLSAGTPFVLLDDARPGGRQALYHTPRAVIVAHEPYHVAGALSDVRHALRDGHHVAGYLAYEAGHALEPRLLPLAPPAGAAPLLWFGLFDRPRMLDEAALAALLGDPAGAWIGAVRPGVEQQAYQAMHARVQALIAAGDIYQANLSFRAHLPVAGPPPAVYARLRANSRAGWGGIVHDGKRWLLSLSPEQFFRLEDGMIAARPMKGTAPRGRTPAADDEHAARLAADPKERAENLMIVDLIRNDLARVAVPGSVRVPRLFEVERYPTVQQMVSEVTATLAPGHDAVDLLRALYPCGSITGAPKLRAMEVIHEVEADRRRAYTGSIGALSPDGDAVFNVAIRTLELDDEEAGVARLGLGSAVVADSTAAGEWAECLAKAAFAHGGAPAFDLIETMRFDPDEGICDLERHIARLNASARALGFTFDRHALRNELHTATFRLRDAARVRLRLSPRGAFAIEVGPMPAPLAQPLRVAVVPLPVHPADPRLCHKTSDRGFYDAARQASAADEVIFVRPDGRLTEGSFTSLFVPVRHALVTPAAEPGLLPGILRARLMEEGRAIEGDLYAEDLREGFFVGNALRGLMEARLV